MSQNDKLEVDHFDLTVSKAMTSVARKMTGQSKTEEPMSNMTSPGRDCQSAGIEDKYSEDKEKH